MEWNKPKIEIYATRTISEKLNDTFSFLRENWRPILKYFIYLMLPVSIVLAFFMNHFWSGYMSLLTDIPKQVMTDDSDLITFGLNTGLMALCMVVAYTLLSALIFALIRLYRNRPERLQGLTADILRPELLTCLKRSAVMTLATGAILMVVLVVIGVIAGGLFSVNFGLGLLFLVLFYIAMLAVAVPLALVTPIYLMEDETGLVAAFTKAYRLGFATWGGIVVIIFITGIVGSVVQSVTSIPWYMFYMVRMIFTLSNDFDGSVVNNILFTFGEYITCVLQCLGMLLSSVISLVGLTIQYGHASDKIDGTGVAKKIEQFDEFDNF
jgi:hypothetical protein